MTNVETLQENLKNIILQIESFEYANELERLIKEKDELEEKIKTLYNN